MYCIITLLVSRWWPLFYCCYFQSLPVHWWLFPYAHVLYFISHSVVDLLLHTACTGCITIHGTLIFNGCDSLCTLFLQGYKPKYVLLSNSLHHKCKAVELLDSDGSKSSLEVIRLTDVWSVQDKPSRTKYAFEVSHVVLAYTRCL